MAEGSEVAHFGKCLFSVLCLKRKTFEKNVHFIQTLPNPSSLFPQVVLFRNRVCALLRPLNVGQISGNYEVHFIKTILYFQLLTFVLQSMARKVE